MAASQSLLRRLLSLTAIIRGFPPCSGCNVLKWYSTAVIYRLPFGLSQNNTRKRYYERLMTCEKVKVKPRLTSRPGSGSGGKQGNGNIPRNGHVILPASLLAISIFTWKNNEVQEAIEKLKDVDELELILRRAKLAEIRHEWHDAAEFYHQALSLLNVRKQQEIWDEPRVIEAQVYIYDNMANLALSQGRLDDAELLYKETVKGLLGMGKVQDDNAIVEISLKLAMIYAMQQRDKDAEAGYKFCMSTMETKMTKMDPVDDDTLALYGMCVNSFSRFLIIHDRLEEAGAAVRITIDVAVRSLSEDHAQVAVLYSDLATVASKQGNQDAAKEHIEKAIAIGQNADSPDVAMFLCNRGMICIEKGEFDEARKCCRKALRLAKGLNDPETEKAAELCLKDVKKGLKKS